MAIEIKDRHVEHCFSAHVGGSTFSSMYSAIIAALRSLVSRIEGLWHAKKPVRFERLMGGEGAPLAHLRLANRVGKQNATPSTSTVSNGKELDNQALNRAYGAVAKLFQQGGLYWKSGEDAYHGRNGLHITTEQRAQVDLLAGLRKETSLEIKLNKELADALKQQRAQVKRVDSDSVDLTNLSGIEHHLAVVGPIRAGVAHMQGMKPTQEDESLIDCFEITRKSGVHMAQVLGIFDGHGGDAVSKFLKAHLSSYLKEALEKYNPNDFTDKGIHKALEATFLKIDRDYRGSAGSTATVSLIINGNLWVANVGDSRTVLWDGEKTVQLSEDQKCDNPKYAQGVTDRGGVILNVGIPRVNGNLAVPRAIGDHYLKGNKGERCVIALPSIVKIPMNTLKPGSFLLAACDGIWDVMTSDEAVDQIRKDAHLPLQTQAARLAKLGFKLGSMDNLSALITPLSLG